MMLTGLIHLASTGGEGEAVNTHCDTHSVESFWSANWGQRLQLTRAKSVLGQCISAVSKRANVLNYDYCHMVTDVCGCHHVRQSGSSTNFC
jgi:hypothetical protein